MHVVDLPSLERFDGAAAVLARPGPESRSFLLELFSLTTTDDLNMVTIDMIVLPDDEPVN